MVDSPARRAVGLFSPLCSLSMIFLVVLDIFLTFEAQVLFMQEYAIMEYDGMTVNERLYASGQLKDFDEAVKRQDVDRLIDILHSVGLNDELILPVLKAEGFCRDESGWRKK